MGAHGSVIAEAQGNWRGSRRENFIRGGLTSASLRSANPENVRKPRRFSPANHTNNANSSTTNSPLCVPRFCDSKLRERPMVQWGQTPRRNGGNSRVSLFSFHYFFTSSFFEKILALRLYPCDSRVPPFSCGWCLSWLTPSGCGKAASCFPCVLWTSPFGCGQRPRWVLCGANPKNVRALGKCFGLRIVWMGTRQQAGPTARHLPLRPSPGSLRPPRLKSGRRAMDGLRLERRRRRGMREERRGKESRRPQPSVRLQGWEVAALPRSVSAVDSLFFARR